MRRNVTRATRLVGAIDPWIILSFLALLCIGVLMVYSASIADSYANYGTPYYVFEREVIWVGLGLLAFVFMLRVEYHRLERIALLVFGGTVLALMFVLVPHLGHVSHGASRWISIGAGVTLEPSELVKLTLVIYLAHWLASKGDRVREFKACCVPFCAMVGLVAILIVRQPDLGTTMVVSGTAFAVYFISGGEMRHIAAVLTGGVAFAWIFAHNSSYRNGRLTSFMDPWKEATGAGYHSVQVLLALGSGGIGGRGLGNSIQKDVLPAPHTDSILAVIGEEWGLIGTVFVLLLFVVIAYRGLRIATSAPDQFGRLLAAGITSWITLQALMNYAVITSSVPFTGVPLPFISYGGSSLIISMAAMGVLLNISRHTSGEGLAREHPHHRRGNGRTRVPRVIDHPTPAPAGAGSRRERPRPLQADPVNARNIDQHRAPNAVTLGDGGSR